MKFSLRSFKTIIELVSIFVMKLLPVLFVHVLCNSAHGTPEIGQKKNKLRFFPKVLPTPKDFAARSLYLTWPPQNYAILLSFPQRGIFMDSAGQKRYLARAL